MKKTVLLFSLLIAFSFALSAQKPFAGNIKSKTTVEGTTDANILSQNQRESEVTMLGSKVKTDMAESGIGITVIADGDDMTNTVIFDLSVMGYGIYYKVAPVETNLVKFDYTYDKEDIKTIAGYKCHKATCVMTNLETDEEETFILYVSEELTPDYRSTQFVGLKGYPFYTSIEVDHEGSSFRLIDEIYEVKANKKVKSVDFLLPDGSVSFDEAPAELKAMFGMEEE